MIMKQTKKNNKNFQKHTKTMEHRKSTENK